MDRETILNALLADAAITNLATANVEGNEEPQIYLWMTPYPEVFPRVVLRETDDSMVSGADDRASVVRQLYEVAFTVKANDWATFIALCGLIPRAIAGIGGRHASSTPDLPVPEHGAVTKSQTFEFYEYVLEDEEE